MDEFMQFLYMPAGALQFLAILAAHAMPAVVILGAIYWRNRSGR